MFNNLLIIPKYKALSSQRWRSCSVRLVSGMLLLTAAPLTQALAQPVDNDYRFQPTLADNKIDATAYCDNEMDYMRLQLPVFQHTKTPSSQAYFAYQAQAWLQYAKHENVIDNASAAGTDALQRGGTILQALQDGNEDSLALTSDIPATSALMRPDLWATLSALKASGGITHAPKAVAFSEVALIWAAADHCKYGADASSAPFQMADRWLQQAREAYVHNHEATSNVQLESLINRYYQHYAPLAAADDNCTAQALSLTINTPPLDHQSPNNQNLTHQNTAPQIDSTLALPVNIIIQMLTPTVTYQIVD